MEAQHLAIKRWLEEVLGRDQAPDYEINAATLEVLQQLMTTNKRQTKILHEVQSDMKRTINEYESEAKRLSSVLEWVGISVDKLSEADLKVLQHLVELAMELNTRDTDLTSLTLGMCELSRQQSSCSTELKTTQLHIADIESRLAVAKTQHEQYKRALAEEKERSHYLSSVTEERTRRSGFLVQKSKQYCRQAELLQMQLQANEYNPEISHSSLVQLGEEIKVKKARLTSLKSQVASYQNLPANIDLAKLKLQECQQELERLDEEIARNIDLTHTNR